MKIILISGKAMAGKDSTANFLKQKLERNFNRVLITHFADLLKYICQNFFEWDGQKNEEGRTLLQFVGTDTIRAIKPNYWVDFIVEFLTMFYDEWDYILIPDCRFANELEKFAGFDTVNLRVNRLNFDNGLTFEQKYHPSETALDNYKFDYVINSESGLDNLEKEVDKFLKWMEGFGV